MKWSFFLFIFASLNQAQGLEKIPYSAEIFPSKELRHFWVYKKGPDLFLPTRDLEHLLGARIHYYPKSKTVVLKLKQQKRIEATEGHKFLFLGKKPLGLAQALNKLPNSPDILLPLKALTSGEASDYMEIQIEQEEGSRLKIFPYLEIEAPRIEKKEDSLAAEFSLPQELENYEITLLPEEKKRSRPAMLNLRFPYARMPTPSTSAKTRLYFLEKDTREKTLNIGFPLPEHVSLSDINAYQKSWPSRTLVIEIAGFYPKEQKPIPIEVKEATAAVKKPTLRLVSIPKKEAPPAKKPLKTSQLFIVIDPGHGGKDAGTTSPSGFREKELNFAMAVKIENALTKILPGNRIVLTRSRDIFLNPEARAAFIRKKNPDLLVSIHANSSRAHNRGGYEIYIPSDISLDPETMELVARENKPANSSQILSPRKVEKLLVKKSENLARNITQSLSKNLNHDIRNRGIRKGNFLILREAAVPAVLIETGFLSNATDERLLRDEKFQLSFASSVAQGISNYLQEK